MFCGDDTLVGIGHHDVKLTPLLCKRWQCEICMPKRLRQLCALASSGLPTTLLTLTVSPKNYPDQAAAARDLVRSWRLMRQRLTREGWCQKQPFLAVFEDHKSGWPHLHILTRLPYIPQRLLSRWHQSYTRSFRVDIRRVWNRRHASRYISKYVSKGPARYEGCKRYWRSQDYATDFDPVGPIHDQPRRWFRERASFDYIAHSLGICDWSHVNEPDGTVTMIPGKSARWLWWEHAPPEDAEVSKCRPLL